MGRADLPAILLYRCLACTMCVCFEWIMNGNRALTNSFLGLQRSEVGQAGIWQTLVCVGLSFAAAFCTTAVPWL